MTMLCICVKVPWHTGFVCVRVYGPITTACNFLGLSKPKFIFFQISLDFNWTEPQLRFHKLHPQS